MTSAPHYAVSLLPLQDLGPAADLFPEAFPGMTLQYEPSRAALEDRIKSGRCDLVLAGDDPLGQSVLDATTRGAPHVVVVVRKPSVALTSPQRRALRAALRARGASAILFSGEVTLGVLEAVSDMLLATRPTTQPAQAAVTSTPVSLDVDRTQLLAALERHLTQGPTVPPFTLVVLSIDLYREVCDSLQTLQATTLLGLLADRLRAIAGHGAHVAYLGGGRFAVLPATSQDPGRLLEALPGAWAEPFVVGGQAQHVSLSTGLTRGTRSYECPEDVLRDGITAVRAAKQATPAVFETSMRVDAVRELRLEAELRAAVRDRNFTLNYQPIVTLAGVKLVGFEALVRWTSPTLGFVSPAQFIPVLERTDLIVELGAWIMQTAAEQAGAWSAEFELAVPLVMSVNVSAKQLPRTDLADHVRDALAASAMDPSSLKLEFTETATMESPVETAASLARCRDLGVKIWVDDFGTGYSSLAHIQQFPIDGLKLDKSFVDPLNGTAAGSTMAKAVLQIADVVGVDVVAEGIESATQAAELRHLGCRYAQGYHFSRPLSVADAYAYIARNTG